MIDLQSHASRLHSCTFSSSLRSRELVGFRCLAAAFITEALPLGPTPPAAAPICTERKTSEQRQRPKKLAGALALIDPVTFGTQPPCYSALPVACLKAP